MADLFFTASKVIGSVARIESLLALVLALALIRLRSERYDSARRWLTLGLLAIIALALLPLGNVLLDPLESRFPARPTVRQVDGIIILGGGADPVLSAHTGQPELNAGGDRYTAAVTLARRFPEAPVFFTGGNGNLTGPKNSEANTARQILTDLGIAESRLHFEGVSRTTAENATLLRKSAHQKGKGSWLLVTSARHMPRAMGSFCAAGWSNLLAWPVDYRTGRFRDGIGWDLPQHLADLNTGLKEWLGLGAYYAAGRSSALLPRDCSAGQ